MTSKPFEIFKPEDFKPMLGRTDCRPENLACFIANRILNERGKRGYTLDANNSSHEKSDVCGSISTKLFRHDTQEALVFLRPIEEEKEACDHIVCIEESLIRELGNTFIERCDFDYCPKCGDKLSE